MDAIEIAYAHRARSALDMMTATGPARAQAKAFVELARCFAAENQAAIMGALERSSNETIKAVAAHATTDAVWASRDIQAMAASFIASVAEIDLLTIIARTARVIPRAATRVLIASGAVGNVIAEGAPKPVKRLDLSVGVNTEFVKTVAMVVCSEELLRASATSTLFEHELGLAVVRAANAAVVAFLTDSNTTTVAAGADPLASLRAGLGASGPSTAYVVAMPPDDVAWLATSDSNRGGMGVRGGTFVQGVEIVALDGATEMTVIPADRLALIEGGLELRQSGEATVDLADSPTSPGTTKVSLWQTNSRALLAERYWRLDGDMSGIVRVGA